MRWSIVLTLILMLFALGACSGAAEDESRAVTLADASLLPVELHGAHREVRDAYRYAIANPEEVAKYPCYCGCNSIGHMSNLDCYVREAKREGELVFDLHGANCGVCVAITQDVMRMKRKGMASPDIRSIIDSKYNQFGPPTDTAFPQS